MISSSLIIGYIKKHPNFTWLMKALNETKQHNTKYDLFVKKRGAVKEELPSLK